ncbi:MAG TPA: lysozyme inhibitor LprI family protein [Rhodanobacter sp.]|nr:lysozyme inhibitor LprI family protein [Rhodanobacter sp.]
MVQRTFHIGPYPFRARRIALAFVVLLAAGGPAWADDCKNATSTVQMNECMVQGAKVVDAKLNETYRRVLATLDGADDDAKQSYPASTKAALIEAQRAWVKYRDADCKAVFNRWKGGTIRTVMEQGCMKDRAEQRIKELAEFLQNQ